jgi:PAS domain S-box-containing protein
VTDEERPPGYGDLSADQMRMGLELAGVGLTKVDYVADTVVLDPLAGELFGLPAGVLVDRTAFHQRIHPDDWPEVEGQVNKLLDSAFEDAIIVEHRTFDAEGEVRWVRARKQLYRGGKAQASTGVAAVLDVTAERRAQEAQNYLVRELQHRTKNLFAVVGAVARLLDQDGKARFFLDRFLPRIAGLARNQQITGDQHADQTIGAVVERAARPFLTDHEDGLRASGPKLVLSQEASQTLGMIVHELSTNAVKYGAWSVAEGCVEVGWQTEEDGFVLFSWQERGGPPPAAPKRAGFGTRILEQYARLTLSAEPQLAFTEEGLRYSLRIPPEGYRPQD